MQDQKDINIQFSDLNDYGNAVLYNSDPQEKVRLTLEAFELYQKSRLTFNKRFNPPDNPSRPSRPVLFSASKMPRRSTGAKGKIALIHAIAHIELNAIDLAWDMIVRFGISHNMPIDFSFDWLKVAYDEAIHFDLLSNRLKELNSEYGDLPAHNGLWEAAFDTKDNLGARLAVVPMVLEARGLDVTPKMIEKFENSGDEKTVKILKRIYIDEITHVHTGVKWFEYVTKTPIRKAVDLFHNYLKYYFTGGLIPPFNIPARNEAKIPRPFYEKYDKVI